MTKLASVFVSCFVAAVIIVPASGNPIATLDYTLNVAASGGPASGPFGTVHLAQTSLTDVTVTVTLNAGNFFVDTGGPHEGFAFNITGDPTINTPALQSGWIWNTPISGDATPFGTYNYTMECTGCGPGASNAQAGPLVFDVTRVSGNLSINSFSSNADGYFFAADIIGNNGKTGTVASTCITDCGGGGTGESVPEPVSFLLAGSGLIGMYFIRRRRPGSR